MLPPSTTIGPVSLFVPDLERSILFYEDVLGFKTHLHEGDTAELGAPDGTVLLELIERPTFVRPSRHNPGLFHFAILFPTRADLGRSLIHLSESEWKLSGAGDHLVSEALYLDDPDGNGIELYADRPSETWEYQDGLVQMDTLAVDMESLIAAGREDESPWHGIPDGTKMGHVHLKVSDLEATGEFYRNLLGFALMAKMPQALFVSVGGYHHHIGLNTWMSENYEDAPADSLGLKGFTINVPTQADLDVIEAKLIDTGTILDFTDLTPFLRDPSGIGIWIKVQPELGV